MSRHSRVWKNPIFSAVAVGVAMALLGVLKWDRPLGQALIAGAVVGLIVFVLTGLEWLRRDEDTVERLRRDAAEQE